MVADIVPVSSDKNIDTLSETTDLYIIYFVIQFVFQAPLLACTAYKRNIQMLKSITRIVSAVLDRNPQVIV